MAIADCRLGITERVSGQDIGFGTKTKLGNGWRSRSVLVRVCDDMGALLTNLIVGFLAGACIRRTRWQVLVWFILPLLLAILEVSVEATPFRLLIERDARAVIPFCILAYFGFIATGAGLALGALFRALIKRISPKGQNGTNSQGAPDGQTDRKD